MNIQQLSHSLLKYKSYRLFVYSVSALLIPVFFIIDWLIGSIELTKHSWYSSVINARIVVLAIKRELKATNEVE